MKNVFSAYLKLLLLVPSLLLGCVVHSQSYCQYPNAFFAPSYPQQVDTFTVIVDTTLNYYGDTFFVKLKFAVPKNDQLPFTKRPLMLGVHGGGFISDYVSTGAATQAYDGVFSQMQFGYAPCGWIGVSLDYRTGFGLAEEAVFINALGNPGSSNCNLLSQYSVMQKFTDAAYLATVDCRKAIDYIFTHASQFPYIDTTQIYLLGGSAGAITVLHSVFSEKNEFYPSSQSNKPNLAPKHSIAGVIAFAGAMTNNYNGISLHHIDTGESVPIFMGHGTTDPIVSYLVGPIAECQGQAPWYGSQIIANTLVGNNVPHELFLIDSAGHDLGGGYPVNYLLTLASFEFIKTRGLCPQNNYSYHKKYRLDGSLIYLDSFSNYDCHGDLGGHAELDKCGICSGGNTGIAPNSSRDCLGNCLGNAKIDSCGNCLSANDTLFNQSCRGCDGVLNSGKILDSCGVCMLPNDSAFSQSCRGCDGVLFSGKRVDSCAQCLHPSDTLFNATCKGCDGVAYSGKIIDSCFSCLHPADPLFNASCKGCDGIVFSGKIMDSCSMCLHPSDSLFNTICKGCDGIIHSEKRVDSCMNCLHPLDSLFNESCRGCDGQLFSETEWDTCQQCLHPTHPDFNRCVKTDLVKTSSTSWLVYPNPANDKLTVCLPQKSQENYSLEISSIEGKKIYQAQQTSPCLNISTEHFPTGIYFLMVRHQNEIVFKEKILIE